MLKAWCTDRGTASASEAVQVHGGAGFIEETGAAQHYRDSRIMPIYEGTNGIQALDLVRRKVLGDRGGALGALIADMRADAGAKGPAETAEIRAALARGIDALEETTRWLLNTAAADGIDIATAASTPYLEILGTGAGGWMMARAAELSVSAAGSANGESDFYRNKTRTARFYAEVILPRATSLKQAAIGGATILREVEEMSL